MSFKKPSRKRSVRQRDGDEEEEEADGPTRRMEDIREIQKSRERPSGLSASELALGTEAAPATGPDDDDPYKSIGGGLIDLKALKRGRIKKATTLEDDLKGNFSKESHLRDEDEEMRKFVEAEIARRKGVLDDSQPSAECKAEMDMEEAIYQLPERMKKYQSKKNEEMLSNQMLVGIPEVDLGMDAKIRNIEETEASKLRLLREAAEKRRTLEEVTSYNQDLVKDLACDFVQHHQFNIAATTDLGSLNPTKKKELEEVMADADNFNMIGEEAVPYMMADKFEKDEDDREDAVCDGNWYAD